MDNVSVNGEQYVKASSIARELGYTADYVGQLCRGGKVDAQLIGRSWYVSERSIREHKRDRYRSTKAKSKESVREQLAAQTQTVTSLRKPSHFYKSVSAPLAHRYEFDSHDLLPAVPTRVERERQELSEEPEQKEVVQEHQEDTVTVVPIRTIQEPERPERPWKPEPRPLRTETKRQHEATLITNEDTSEVVLIGHDRRGGSIIVGILSTVLALAGLLALVGLESQVIADSSSSAELYQFNLASVAEALLHAEK